MDIKIISKSTTAIQKETTISPNLPWYGRNSHPETRRKLDILKAMELGVPEVFMMEEYKAWHNIQVRIRQMRIKAFAECYGRKYRIIRLEEIRKILIVRVK